MTTMELTYDAAQAETQRLVEQRQSWTDKRAALQTSLEATHARAGDAALAGTSTAKIAEQIGRTQMELQIAERALQALEVKEHEAKRSAQRARIAELRTQAAEKRAQAVAVSAKAAPHMDALFRIEGVRPFFERSRSCDLELEADRIDRSIEWLESRLEER